MSSFKKIQSSQLTSKSTPKSSPRPSTTPQPARLPSLSPNTAEEQREEDKRQRQALAKPKLEIRSIEQLREYINSIKHCGVDNLHDPNDSRTVPFSESIEYLKGQQATKFSVRVWKDGKRVLQLYRKYPDTLRAYTKSKLIKKFPEYGLFEDCYPVDILISRFINNKNSIDA